jgi:kinesin family protein 18/19
MFLRRGNRNRSQEPTGANEVSSRSHAVLQVCFITLSVNLFTYFVQVLVTFRKQDENGNVMERHGKLSMIDLAGSGKNVILITLPKTKLSHRTCC